MQYQTEEFAGIDEWLAARDRGIGSSDAPIILGLTPWLSPLALYHQKRFGLGLSATDPGREPKYKELAQWGKDAEDLVASRYQIATGRPVIKPPANTIARHKTIPWLQASVDRYANVVTESETVPLVGGLTANKITMDSIVVECKWAHFMSKTKWIDKDEGREEPPLEYVVQVQHQLAVTGAPWASIAVVIGGTMFKYADIQRDDAFIGNLIAKEEQFWQDVRTGKEPPADAHQQTADLLKALYPKSQQGKVIELPPEAMEWFDRLAVAKAEIKRLTDGDVAQYSNLLRQAMGDAELGTLRNGNAVSYKSSPRAGYTVKPTTQRPLLLKDNA